MKLASILVAALAAAALAGCYANGGPAAGAAGSGGDIVVTPGAGQTASGKSLAPSINFEMRPASIKQGQTSAAVWTTSGATSCEATGDWSGALSVNNPRGTTIGPMKTAGTFTYGMSCSGSGGTTAVNMALGVGTVPAPTVQLTLTPSSVTPGNSVLITWSTTNAESCTATGGTGTDGWSGSKAVANSTGFRTSVINTVGEYNYDLTCTGTGGTTEQSALLNVSTAAPAAAPTVSFAAQPTLILPGQATSFTWTTNNATSCAASGGSGADAWSGAEPTSSGGTSSGPIAAAGIYSYTLTCAGPGGSTAQSVTVVVSASPQPPSVSVSIQATPAIIVAGQSAALTWSSSNADSCTASGSWSGSEALVGSAVSTGTLTAPGNTPTNYSYTLLCSVAGGSASGTASVTVDPAPAAVTNFAASPTVISSGQTTSLTWATSAATSCAASGGTGSDGWSGSVAVASSGTSVGPITTAGTYVYSLICTGPGGTGAPQSVGVLVNPVAPPPASVASFSATPSTISVGQSTDLTWSTNSATACTASGGAGSAWSGSVGTSGTAFNTGAINSAGSYTFTLSCTGPGGAGNPSSVVVNVTNAPLPAASITAFSVSPTSMSSGQAASLSWSTSNATSCTGSGDTGTGVWNGAVGTASSGFSTGVLTTPASYSYTLTCTGPGGTSTPSTVIVNVSNAPPSAAVVSQFTASPTTLSTGQATTLAWSSTNATSCTASGGSGADLWSGAMPTSSTGFSTGAIANTGTFTYTLTCTGPGGSAGPSSVVVSVTTPPASPATINAFTATPSIIQAGQSATLAWSTTGASTCTATGGTGTDGWAGSQPVFSSGTSTGAISSAGTYTYTLNCSGSGGASGPSSVIINVNSVPPPAASITSLSASPTSLVVGQSTSLAWSTSSATACTASGGSGADNWTGSVATSSTGMTVGPINTAGNFAYQLTCTGPGGSSGPTSVTVDVASAPPVPTISTFTASPTTIQTGQSISLAWSSSGATACVASGGTGADGWSGAEPVSSSGTSVGPINVTGSETYTVTCSGAGGTSTPSSVSITVTATPPAASIASFTATPSSLQSGGASSLAWTSSNADSCTAGGGSGSDGWGGPVATSSSGTSTGALSAGTYTYTLTCTGPGGGSPTSSAVVTVTNAPPAASITSFVATPSALTVGQSTQLSWSTSAATSCTASGGTGADGWNGAKPVSSSGTGAGPLNTAGTYVYTLICTGAGGTSAPASVGVTVTAPVPASISNFAASPTSLTAGQSASLSWTSSAATSCTASGGTGSDGWSGLKGTSSTGTSTGPLTTVGTVTYTLTCTGAGGTSAPRSTSVTVNAVVPVQPTVTLLANGGSSATVVTGGTVTLSWSSSNATSCTASGGSASDWSGTKTTASSGVAVGPVSGTPGIYAYTLSCSGPGGSGTSTVQIQIMPQNGSDCGVGVPTTNLVGPEASATGSVNGGIGGLLCLGCSVSNPGYLTDASPQTYATMIQPVGVLGTTSLTVNGSILYPAGRKVGFVLTEGNGLLTASLLQGVTVETLLGSTVQESATIGGLLNLDALGLIAVNPNAGFATFTTTKPFNSLAIVAGSVASVIATYNVYDACVSLQ
jgi:hypothetical protein